MVIEEAFYGIIYLLGALILHVSFANLTKRIKSKIQKRVTECAGINFLQNTELIESPDTYNLPMQVGYKKKYMKDV